jgi:hypothetical protein
MRINAGMADTPIIDAIFDAFGGPTKFAETLEEPLSTVHAWKGSKYGIPRWRRPQILEHADKAPKPLPPAAVEYLSSNVRIAA